MDTVIGPRSAVRIFFGYFILMRFLILDSSATDIKCIESGRFYRNPEASSKSVKNSDFPSNLEEECSKYYLCVEGEVFNFQCSSGLAFDIDKQTCEAKETIKNCDKKTESKTNICKKDEKSCPDNKTTCIKQEFFCDGHEDCPEGEDERFCDSKNDNYEAPICNPNKCKLPQCFCSLNGTENPGNFPLADLPQMVLLTFDDAINENNIDFYNDIFSDGNYLNPNNCPIVGTFFVSHQYNNYFFAQKLWNQGHEIAVHSITHRLPEEWWAENATVENWFDEMVGQANILHKYANIQLSELKGLRVPFFRIGWNRQYLMMKEFGFQYDSSIVAPFSYIPLWPYTLDYKMPHKCFRQKCPTRSYPGLFEMVINPLEAKDVSCATLDSCPSDLTGEEIYEMLMRNFNRHISTNRAPFGIHLQAVWFDNVEYFTAIKNFLDTVLSKPDVWFVTNSQAIEWIQNPTPLKKLLKFHPWDCRKMMKKTRKNLICDKPKSCRLISRLLKEEIEFQTCSECPTKYPWIKNEFGIL